MKAKMIFASILFALSAGVASADDKQEVAGVISTDPLHPYSHTFDHVSGPFTDTIDFVIPNPSLGTSANPLYLNLNGTKVTNIAGLMYTLFGGTSTAPSGDEPYGTFIGNDTSYNLSLAAAGAYHIIITGEVIGSATTGSYALALVSAVPEPATYAMMLMGVGMMGYVARRRQRRG